MKVLGAEFTDKNWIKFAIEQTEIEIKLVKEHTRFITSALTCRVCTYFKDTYGMKIFFNPYICLCTYTCREIDISPNLYLLDSEYYCGSELKKKTCPAYEYCKDYVKITEEYCKDYVKITEMWQKAYSRSFYRLFNHLITWRRKRKIIKKLEAHKRKLEGLKWTNI